MNAGITLLVVAAFATAGVLWLRTRTGQSPPANASRASKPVESMKIAATGVPAVKEIPSNAVLGSEKPRGEAKTEISDAPLRTGEILEFTANVSKLTNVANLRVTVIDQRSFLGKTVWHLRADAHTENPLRMVFALDDQFDSYSDTTALTSVQYEMHLNERGERVESVQRMMTGGSPPADATAAIVLPGTRDPLGLLEYMRNVDWTKSAEVRSPVYDGRKLYSVQARFRGSAQKVSVPAGDFTTSKIELRVFDNGTEMKDSHFFLYLANNSSRTPVLLEAVMPFADARVELLKSQ